MLKQIDRDLSYDYEFYLCRRDTREPIATLKHGYNMYNAVYSPEYRNVDELSMEIPFYVRDNDMQLIKNPIWDKVKSDMVIRMIVSINDEELFKEDFIINTPRKSGGSEKKKLINCYGYEQSLNNIKLRSFEGTRQLYLSPDETVEVGMGILNLLEEKSYGDWKVGYIDPKAMDETIQGQDHRKYRTFTVDDMSWLQFIRDQLEPTFECVFEFEYDEIQKCNIMNIYHVDNYGEDLGLYISENNYLDRLEEELNIDELITRLTVKGKDGIVINSVNLGRGHIEDFSYYRNLDYMTQDLLDAFDDYDNLVAAKTPIFQGYLDTLNNLTQQLNTKSTEKATLKSEMEILQDNKDIAIYNEQDQTSINQQISAKQTEINNKQVEIDGINTEITTVTNNINNLNNEVKIEINFSNEHLKVINRYLREAAWSNENYYEINSLFEAGKKAQKKMNEPQLNLSLELASFIDTVEGQYDWKKLKIGNVVSAEYTLWDTFFQLRIVKYTHDITNKTLSIELSNKDFRYDSQRYLSELSKDVSNTSGLVNSKKGMWDMSNQNGAWISDFIANGLDAATYAVTMNRNNQQISIDERGVKLASTDDPGVVRMLNNIIAMSEDGESYDLALTPQGIIARKLIGELIAGEKLIINNESGTVQIDGDALTVKTPENEIKLKLGKLGNSKYGIQIFGASGNVILDERGMLQTLPYLREDNLDSANPLLFLVNLPSTTLSVRSAKLSFLRLPFRAYEKAAKSGGNGTKTSDASSKTTTDDGGASYSILSSGIRGDLTDLVGTYNSTARDGDHYHTFTMAAIDHTHNFSTDDHSHGMSHTHDVQLPAHTHPLDFGIFTDTLPTNTDVWIDGVRRLDANFNDDQMNIDITQWIQTGGIHRIELTSETLGRIHASLILEIFVST